MTTGPVQARITEKRLFLVKTFYVLPKSGFMAKNAFYPKKTPEISEETDIHFGKQGFARQLIINGYWLCNKICNSSQH